MSEEPDEQTSPAPVENNESPSRFTSFYETLSDFIATISPVKFQFLLAILLTMGVGGTKKLAFSAQSVMNKTIFKASVHSEAKRQSKFVAFGFSKAIANVLGAICGDLYGKKYVMAIGWGCGIIFSIMVLISDFYVTVWSNIFLGFQQGIVWSLLIFVMVDYAGPMHRGLAVGINETAGYTAVAIFNKVGPMIWTKDDDSLDGDAANTITFWAILGFMILGLILTLGSIFMDTHSLVTAEQTDRNTRAGVSQFSTVVTSHFPSGKTKETNVFRYSFAEASCFNNSLMACCLVGLMINYTTTFAWGTLKTWTTKGEENWIIDSATADNIVLTYDLTKGLCQFMFGFISDIIGRFYMIVGGLSLVICGMLGYAITGLTATSNGSAEIGFFICSFLLGFGVSMMYAIVIAAVAESADPSWRSSAVGSYRFWRDSGYAIGGLVLGFVTDSSGYPTAVFVTVGILIVVIGLFITFFDERVEGENPQQQINSEFK